MSKFHQKMSTMATAGLIAAVGVPSANASAFDPSAFFLPTESFDRARIAVETLQNAPRIKRLLQNQAHALTLDQRITGAEIETTKLRHYFKGIEVYGSVALHHRGMFSAAIRDSLKNFDLDVNPTLSLEQTVLLAKSLTGDRPLLTPPVLKIFPSNDEADSARLIYWVEMDESLQDGARDLLIDAHTGEVLANISKHIEVAPIQVYSAANQGVDVELRIIPAFGFMREQITGCKATDLATGETQDLSRSSCDRLLSDNQCQVLIKGSPVAMSPKACTETARNGKSLKIADAASKRALANSKASVEYFLNTHDRDSYDGKGSTVLNVVHAGVGYANAHWDLKNKRMVYGDGNGKTLGDFTLARDVAGHEFTHGVGSQTSRLLGMGESGALDEAFADFFGKMIEGDSDWTVGRKLFIGKDRGKRAIRDLAEPSNLKDSAGRAYPSHTKEMAIARGACNSDNDACYVHFNATIPGHAMYLMAQAIGKPKTEKLLFAVLTQGLTDKDDFKDAGGQIRSFCKQMYTNPICGKVDQALAQTGL